MELTGSFQPSLSIIFYILMRDSSYLLEQDFERKGKITEISISPNSKKQTLNCFKSHPELPLKKKYLCS